MSILFGQQIWLLTPIGSPASQRQGFYRLETTYSKAVLGSSKADSKV